MGNVKKLPKRGKYWQETPKGMEIPVPKRGDVLRDLKKVALEHPVEAKQPVEPQETPRPNGA